MDFRGRFRLRSARSWLLAVCLTACGEGPTDPEVPVIVTLTPSGVATLNVGDTLTVRANVQNTVVKEVTFSTSDAGVATVDAASGLVRAVAAGTATVTATSVASTDAYASVQIRVEADRPTSVVISSITDPSGQPVNPGSVSGLINVNLAVERGSAVRLEVLVDSVVGCEQTFTGAAGTAAASVAPVVCPVNTAAFDSISGAPRLFNGSATVSARLLAPGDRPLSSAGGRQVVLANSNLLISRVRVTRQANDAAGLRWASGDVVVDLTPVMFDRGSALSRVDATYRSPTGATSLAADTVAPFRVAFSGREAPLVGLTDRAFQLSITSATTDGSIGPSGGITPFRYDSEPPRPGTITAREWFGSESRFISVYTPVGEEDAGVGRIRPRFFAGDPGLAPADLVERGKEVETGAQLPQAARGSYGLAILVCDALENCVVVPGFTFGVDRTAPVADSANLANPSINPRQDLTFPNLRDDLSGFDALPLEVAVQLLDDDPRTLSCGAAVEGINLPGRGTASSCLPQRWQNRIPVPRGTPGYYTYHVVPVDRAGNRGAPVTRTVLVDLQPPTVSLPALPVQLSGGEDLTVSALATDNLDLVQATFRMVFPRPGRSESLALPFTPPATLGAAFDAVLTLDATATARFPVVRTLTYGSATAGVRSTVLVDSLQVSVIDAAGLTTASNRRIAPSSFGPDTAVLDPFSRYTTIAASPDRSQVCTQRCEPGESMSVRVTVRVVGEGTGPVAPFARLHLYRRGEDGGVVHLGSVSGIPTNTIDTGAQTTFTYSFPEYTPPAGLSGSFTFFAAGVRSQGNALVSDVAAPPVMFVRR